MDGTEIAARLLHLKGAKAECPQCGKTKWANPEPDGRAVLRIANNGLTEEFRPVILVCFNCGLVRMHDEQKLHD